MEADLQNFYESINLEELRKALLKGVSEAKGKPQEKARWRYAVEMMLQLLPLWCYAPTHGLPQNRDASSFLANQYMRDVDRQMGTSYSNYFRYMDDIRICVETRDDARRALVALTRTLRGVGLSLNSKKTKIYQPGSQEHLDLLLPDDRRMDDIHTMWKSRSQMVIARSLGYLAEMAFEIVKEGETVSRKFRFCVNRLEKLARADAGIEIPHRSALKGLVLDRIVEDAVAVDSLCGFLRAVGLTIEECQRLEELLLDEAIYMYEWQRYHIVSLLLDQQYCSARLIEACEGEIFGVPKDLVPRDLALITLGRNGSQGFRVRIAKAYGEICPTHIEQRAAIIAVHELPYGEEVEKFVAPNVPTPLQGMYREIRKKHSGQYFLKMDPIPISSLIDIVSAYV